MQRDLQSDKQTGSRTFLKTVQKRVCWGERHGSFAWMYICACLVVWLVYACVQAGAWEVAPCTDAEMRQPGQDLLRDWKHH
jgi:hypothetical protein